MLVSFKRRFSRHAQARVSYTLSKAVDDVGNAFFFTPQDSANLREERGLADNDQRHRLAVSGSFEAPTAGAEEPVFRRAPSGFQLSYVFQYGSRLPFNVVTGGDRNLRHGLRHQSVSHPVSRHSTAAPTHHAVADPASHY